MSTTTRWTSADLESMPDDGTRYEIIDGELYMSKQPHIHHQDVCGQIFVQLTDWDTKNGFGRAYIAPGIIFADDDDVAPDVVWASNERLRTAIGADGRLHEAPELVIEVLSPGRANERRDREAKLQLYSRRGVSEYWIASWKHRTLEIFRRVESQLRLIETLVEEDILESPVLPGFRCSVSSLFAQIPRTSSGDS